MGHPETRSALTSQVPTEQCGVGDMAVPWWTVLLEKPHTQHPIVSEPTGCSERAAGETEVREGQGLAQHHVMSPPTSWHVCSLLILSVKCPVYCPCVAGGLRGGREMLSWSRVVSPTSLQEKPGPAG